MARIGSTLLLAAALAAPALADDVVLDRTRIATQLGDALEELAKLEGQAGASGRSCARVAGGIDRVRRSLRLLQDEIRSAESAAPVAGSLTVTTGETGVAMHTGTGVVTTVSTGQALPAPAPPAYEAPPTIYPMPGADFSALVAQLRSEAFSKGKLRVLEDAADYAWFTVAQTKQILSTFDFGNDKVKALEIVAPRLYDYDNSFQLYDAFDFDSEKKKARQIIKRSRP